MKTDKEKASYAIGMSIGKGLHRDAVDVDPAILARGLKDAMTGEKTLLTDQEAQEALTSLKAEMNKKQEALRAEAAETNKKEGEAFLAANKTKDGVVTLPSGLQYKILQPGKSSARYRWLEQLTLRWPLPVPGKPRTVGNGSLFRTGRGLSGDFTI